MENRDPSLAKVVSGFSRHTVRTENTGSLRRNAPPRKLHIAHACEIATAKAADYYRKRRDAIFDVPHLFTSLGGELLGERPDFRVLGVDERDELFEFLREPTLRGVEVVAAAGLVGAVPG